MCYFLGMKIVGLWGMGGEPLAWKFFSRLQKKSYLCSMKNDGTVTGRTYIAIDLKSFYASVECVERGLDPLTANLVVADVSRT